MKSDVRRTQARDHCIACSLFPLGTSSISRNRHSHALRRSPFFLAAVRVPVHILDFCNTSQARIVFSSPHHQKCDRRPGFSPRAPNLQSSLLLLQSRMRNAALFWQFCRAHDFQDCDAPNPHESIIFLQFQDFDIIIIAILVQGFSSTAKSCIPTLGAEHKTKFVLRP